MNKMLSLVALLVLTAPALADEERLDGLFEALAGADEFTWEQIEEQIWEEWSVTGSPTLDLLLERGREAMSDGDSTVAVEHFTALIENAPDFAEGYNARATAFFDAGLVGPSLADIVKALTLEPRHFAALAGLGVIFEETGEKTRALDAYRAARAIHPLRPDLREAVERLEVELQGTEI